MKNFTWLHMAFPSTISERGTWKKLQAMDLYPDIPCSLKSKLLVSLTKLQILIFLEEPMLDGLHICNFYQVLFTNAILPQLWVIFFYI